MKITFELIGRSTTQVKHFSLSSPDGKDINDWQAAFEHFKQHSNVLGLNTSFSGARQGVIVLSANNDQLRPEVVADIRGHVQNALAQI